MRAALLTAAACAVAAAPAHATTTAFFGVKIRASQDVSWNRNLTAQGCSDSISVLTGKGEAHLRVHQRGNAWVIATRIDKSRATLQSAAASPVLHAAGTFSRKGEVASHASKPPRDPGACPQGIPVAPDCGTRALPDDSTLSLSYAPGKLGLTGPHSLRWLEERPFKNCPGVNGDNSLGATRYTSGVVQTGPATLPVAKLFGKQKSFTVRWSETRTVETARPGGIVINGTWPVTTTIHWSIRFTRLAKEPQLGALDI